MNIGAPNSPARWLSEHIGTIPTDRTYALMRMWEGVPYLVASGSKEEMKKLMTNPLIEVLCELSKYRAA